MNIRWGARRDRRPPADENPGNIASKQGLFRLQPVGIMVLGMSRSVKYPHMTGPESQLGSIIHRDHPVFRNCLDYSPQTIHLIAVNPGRTLDQPGRADEVGR